MSPRRGYTLRCPATPPVIIASLDQRHRLVGQPQPEKLLAHHKPPGLGTGQAFLSLIRGIESKQWRGQEVAFLCFPLGLPRAARTGSASCPHPSYAQAKRSDLHLHGLKKGIRGLEVGSSDAVDAPLLLPLQVQEGVDEHDVGLGQQLETWKIHGGWMHE